MELELPPALKRLTGFTRGRRIRVGTLRRVHGRVPVEVLTIVSETGGETNRGRPVWFYNCVRSAGAISGRLVVDTSLFVLERFSADARFDIE